MVTELKFVKQYEKYSVLIKGLHNNETDKTEIFLDFPVVMQDIAGAEKRLRYDGFERRRKGTGHG